MNIIRVIITCLVLSLFTTVSGAATVSLSTNDYGSAKDNTTADGTFDSLFYSLSAHAQKTNFLGIFTVTRGMIEFDISSITGPVQNAILSFQTNSVSGPNTTADILGYIGDGVVELADAYAGISTIGSIDIDDTGTYSLDVTDFINSLLTSNSQYAGFNLRMSSEYSQNAVGYDNEINIVTYSSGVNTPPLLTISSVPLPGAVWLFATGLLAITSLVRKKIN